MLVSNVYLWGVAIVAVFVLIASIVLAFFDRKMLRRIGPGRPDRCPGNYGSHFLGKRADGRDSVVVFEVNLFD